ncbi:MAG: RNA 2',3'-cyclic phosphodiesterase [Candidatus Omnitrophota bacterium]
MRLFIAFDISQEMTGELSRLQRELSKTDADIKWVDPQNVHLTIKFLGEVESKKIDRIKAHLDEISAKNKKFEISLFKLGAFPGLDRPRVIWAGVDKGCSEIEAIAKTIDGEFVNLGFFKEDRPFSAHFTLGRVKSGKNKIRLKEILTSLSVDPKACRVDHITLYKSTLTPHGPVYTVLHTAKLTKKP